MKKHDGAHSLFVAIIFTCLYAFFLTAEPGAGFSNSIIKSLDFELLLALAFTVCIGGIIVFGVIMTFCIILSSFWNKNDNFLDVSFDIIGTCCKVSSLVAFCAVAFGFISWGGF